MILAVEFLSVFLFTITFVQIVGSWFLLYFRSHRCFARFSFIRLLLSILSVIAILLLQLHLSVVEQFFLTHYSSFSKPLCVVTSFFGPGFAHPFSLMLILSFVHTARVFDGNHLTLPHSWFIIRKPFFASLLWCLLYLFSVNQGPSSSTTDNSNGLCSSMPSLLFLVYLLLVLCLVVLLSIEICCFRRKLLNYLMKKRIYYLFITPFSFFIAAVLRYVLTFQSLLVSTNFRYVVWISILFFEVFAYFVATLLICIAPYLELSIPEVANSLNVNEETEMQNIEFLPEEYWKETENPTIEILV
ncbi:hypothetical protein P9112_012282 [Eukaryota sp. TZLM1-RC]